ncbi:MAG: type IV toxin-antitoxin system AbiEi family antitoxin [Saprospiraceae bacterium]
MEAAKANLSLEKWVEQQLSLGKYGFALSVLRKNFGEQTETALKFALKRLADKGKILSIYKGYYLILPPQHSRKGILPPALFLDTFMKFLERPYYVALLNAAATHGASHQQPQEYFVVTNFPVLRATQKKSMRINYISVKHIPEKLLEQRKTEAGYLNISNAALTATDLIQFEKRIGGLNRAATVLNELAEVLQPTDFNMELLDYAPATALQRLGYLLEFACYKPELADALYDAMGKHPINFFRIPLKASGKPKGFSSENRWKVIVNTEIEIDE